jgi:hypothetical protein
MRKKSLLFAWSLLCFATFQNANSQTISCEKLSAKLKRKDSIFLNAAFNTCNLNEIETVLSKDFVFYRDRGYGAHRFCHVENGKGVCGIFKFAHFWKKANDEWKISRIVSYDH